MKIYNLPPAHIAGPAIEALRFANEQDELKELYANLLAGAMNSATINHVHPSFVEIIKQLSPEEASLLVSLKTHSEIPLITLRSVELGTNKGFDFIKNFTTLGDEIGIIDFKIKAVYFDNLTRLKIIDIPENYYLTDNTLYQALQNHPLIVKLASEIPKLEGRVPYFQKKTLKGYVFWYLVYEYLCC